MSSKPFDATTKDIVEAGPLDWLRLLGLPGAGAEVIDADLATVTAEADRVLSVQHRKPYLAHIEFQSARDERMAERMLRYNVLLRYRHDVPVRSAVFLLRREADGGDLSGEFRYYDTEDESYLEFRYRVVRVWELNPEEMLASGGVATLPLAPLAGVPARQLPDIVRRMQERITEEGVPRDMERKLWSATYILLGLSHPAAFISELLRGVRQMRESSTYQAILAEGRAEGEVQGQLREVRKMLLRVGGKRFGAPPAAAARTIDGTDDLARLEALLERVLEVESWDELLAV